jgi:UDP-N-acetylmuramoylalanine--D-glutamate ligase
VSFQGRRVLVLGLGVSGLSMARWLAARGAQVRVADSRETPPGLEALQRALPGVTVDLGPFRPESFAGRDLIAVSPGVALAEERIREAVARGVEVVGDVELFARALDAVAGARSARRPRIVAITGSNGKTTVTALTGALCKGAGRETLVAGNIGLPVLDALADLESGARPWPDVVVLELSSFQLETTAALRPDAAVVLNLSEDHLDRYSGMQAYADAKARIFAGAAIQIVNRDDPWTVAMARATAPTWTFGLDAPVGPRAWGIVPDTDGEWLAEGTTRILRTSELQLAGRHNAGNALAALALCRAIGLEYPSLREALRSFRGLPHRMELVAEVAGRRFYDDSKGTNVGATVAAIRGLREPVVLIAGGDGKGQDFSPLAPAVAARARAVVLIGRDRERIAAAVASTGVPLHRASDMDEAVALAFHAAAPGDAVLLSPACASFDMFRNYEHRAEVFRAAVAGLEEGRACSTRH